MEPRNSPQTADQPQTSELPAVLVRYGGPLASLPSLARRLEMDALEREVVVRKVEREVAELERLRKVDEQRVNDETARQLAERLAAEQRRLDELRRRQAEEAKSQPYVDPAAPLDPTAPAPVPDDQNAQDADADSGQSTAPAPAVGRVERAPLPSPASQPASSAKAPRRDPFKPLRENSP